MLKSPLAISSLLVAAITASGVVATKAACGVDLELESHVQLSARQTETLQREVVRIWQPYGVDVHWLSTGNDRPNLESPFLLVVIEPAGSVLGDEGPLGWVHVRSSGLEDRALYASAGSLSEMLKEAEYEGSPLAERPQGLQQQVFAQALGRVIAHELGHFLLGSDRHASQGLMRAHYSPEDLVDSSLRRFRLATENVALLKQRTSCERANLPAK